MPETLPQNKDFQIDRPALVRGFNRAAPGYESVAVLQRTVAERLIEHLDLLRIRPRRILDAGSGTGWGARLLARRFRRVPLLQLDLSADMLKEARRRVSRWSRRHRFLCADVSRLPLADGSIDLIYCNLVLHWCNDLYAVLAEMRRVLCREGLLLFSTCGPDTLRELRQSWARIDDLPHVNCFMDMHDIGDALIRAGLQEPVVESEHLTLSYAGSRELMSELRRMGVSNVLQGRRHSLIGRAKFQRMQREYERYRQPDGRLPATFEITYAHSWRLSAAPPGAAPAPGVATFPLSALTRRAPGAPGAKPR